MSLPNLGDQIGQAINAWIRSLADAVTAPALNAAGALLLQTPDFTTIADVRRLWTIGVGVADSAFVLAALWAGVLIMASGTVDGMYSAKRLLSRLVLAAVLSNASLALCGALIGIDNALVTTLVGANPTVDVWGQAVSKVTGDVPPSVQIPSALLSLVVAVIALLLAVVYIVRDFMLLVATVIAPLALATYGVPQFDEVARVWGRVYAACLFVQVVQAELLNVGMQLVTHSDWIGAPASEFVDLLVLLVLLSASAKLPFWAFRWAFGHSFNEDHLVQRIGTTVRAFREGA